MYAVQAWGVRLQGNVPVVSSDPMTAQPQQLAKPSEGGFTLGCLAGALLWWEVRIPRWDGPWGRSGEGEPKNAHLLLLPRGLSLFRMHCGAVRGAAWGPHFRDCKEYLLKKKTQKISCSRMGAYILNWLLQCFHLQQIKRKTFSDSLPNPNPLTSSRFQLIATP